MKSAKFEENHVPHVYVVMDGLTHLFNTVLQSSYRNTCLGGVLSDCAEHQAFSTIDSSELQSVVAQINSSINEHNNRLGGILILRTFLSQCPDDIFSSNAHSWALHLIKAIGDKAELNDDSERGLALLTLRDIIIASAQFPDVSKQLMNLITKLLIILTMKNIQESEESLMCLQSCMKYYSGQCMSYKAAILKLLLSIVDSECNPLVEVAADCFALLPLLGGSTGGKGGAIINGINANYSIEWNQLLSKVIRTLHLSLNNLFVGVNEVKEYPDIKDVLHVPSEIEEFSVAMKQNLTRNFTNLCKYLCLMLQNPLPAAKIIPVEEVMGLVCRALAVTCNSLKDKVSAEILALAARLPEIHCASISILTTLIASSRLHLLPFGSLIVKLVIQSLKWTSSSETWPSSIRKPYSSVRCSAYRCISLWLRISASASCAEEVAEELINMALLDVVPTKEKLKLMSTTVGNRYHGKYQKRRKTDKNKEDNSAHSLASGMKCAVGNGSGNSEVCCAALEMLSSLLQSVGLFLKPNQHKIMQDTAVLTLIDIQRSSNVLNSKQTSGKECPAGLILPYQSDAKCYMSLLNLLLTLVLEPHSHKWPSPLGLAAQIFSAGQNDSNVEVASFCMTAKRVVERIIHPGDPTLNYPVSLPSMMDGRQSESNFRMVQTEVSPGMDISEDEEVTIREDQRSKEEEVKPQESSESKDSEDLKNPESLTSDLIILSDDESTSLKLSLPLSPSDKVTDRNPSPDILLVRCMEKVDGKIFVEKKHLNGVPLTTLKNKGVQVNGTQLLDDEGSNTPINIASPPPVLVVKIPIEKCSTGKMRDFSQQFVSKSIESVEQIDLNSDDDSVEEEMNNLDDSKGFEFTAKFVTTVLDGETDESKEVMVVEEETSKDESLKRFIYSPEHLPKKQSSKVTERKSKSTSSEVEIVELDDRSDTLVTTEKKMVEIDDENSKVEEMLNCFVDVSSEGD